VDARRCPYVLPLFVALLWQDLEGLKVRLTARNISKVIQTFMNTTERQIDMWMDGCDGANPHIAAAA
jgi:hypothetical protein